MTTKVEAAIDVLFQTPLADGRTPTDAQRADAVIILSRDCRVSDGKVILVDTGEPLDSEASIAWIVENKPHLVPAKYERSLADRAFIDGSLKARGDLVKEVGKKEADRIAETYGLRSSHDTARGKPPLAEKRSDDASNKKPTDHSKNPWHRSNFNITRQGQIFNALGAEKAAAMARSVGSRIGATKPNLDF